VGARGDAGMSARRLAFALVGYFAALAVACAIVHRVVALRPRPDGEVIASVWKDGRLAFRAVLEREDPQDARVATALRATAGHLVFERVTGEGPVFGRVELVLAVSFVAGRDGVRATLAGESALLTPDDLLAAQVYAQGRKLPGLHLAAGLDARRLADMVGQRLHASAEEVLARASWRRVRCVRSADGALPSVKADAMTDDDVKGAALAAARHLARGVSESGRFRYAVLAPSNEDLPGYDWPRHAGATGFLVQAWHLSREPELGAAALRAAAGMTRAALVTCAGEPCIGDTDVVGLGASALALLAYDDIVALGLEPGYRPLVLGLARFLRAQQRADGELMHRFDRRTQRPIDVQGPYYSGEAALALARAYPITGDSKDRDAAARALSYLVGPAWRFFGSRYYFGEEHWTCQAMAALWSQVPNRDALDFCLRWQRYNRALQQREGDAPFDADGAFNVGPWLPPPLTSLASRSEAAAATLEVARRAGVEDAELRALANQLRHALALLVRQQLRPGPLHLFRDPAAVEGAMPGSEVDWTLRIDYAQHAGNAMLRWLQLPR